MIHEVQSELLLSERFSKVAAPDMRAARPLIERLHGPFVAHVGAPAPVKDVDIRAARFGQVAVGTFAFGRTVDIVPNALDDAIVVTTAVRGRAGIEIGGTTFGMDAGQTIIAHERDDPVFMYGPETEVLKLRFHRMRLEDAARRHGAVGMREQLRFDTAMSDPDTATRWLALLRFLVATLNASVRRARSIPELACIEELLMTTLLGNQPHNYQRASVFHDGAASHFDRATAFIHQHLADELSLSDIADAACCSPRSLARAFRQAGETAPMRYVQKLRLERIRSELWAPATQGRTVAEIAFASGYRHLGEFNRQYRAAFGETPSQTRRGACLLPA
jgi:AraC-like DNA-binding protein